MEFNRAEVKAKIYAGIARSYMAHKTMNQILNDMTTAIVDAVADEVERTQHEGLKAQEDASNVPPKGGQKRYISPSTTVG